MKITQERFEQLKDVLSPDELEVFKGMVLETRTVEIPVTSLTTVSLRDLKTLVDSDPEDVGIEECIYQDKGYDYYFVALCFDSKLEAQTLTQALIGQY